jgi:hypothetical protein
MRSAGAEPRLRLADSPRNRPRHGSRSEGAGTSRSGRNEEELTCFAFGNGFLVEHRCRRRAEVVNVEGAHGWEKGAAMWPPRSRLLRY